MALSPLSRRAGALSLTAAILIVLSQIMRLALSRLLGPDWATTAAYTVTYSLALLGMGCPAARTDCHLHPRVMPPWAGSA